MDLLEAVLAGAGRRRETGQGLFRVGGPGIVVSFVGAGGKTSLIYALAEAAARKGAGVLVTTTTRMWDPRDEGRALRRIFFRLEEARGGEGPGIDLLCSGREAGPAGAAMGKIIGIDPGSVRAAAQYYDLVLVEADGSRGFPVKAPASHEPAMPPDSDLVVGVIGLDSLGRSATAETVHRLPEFLAVTGLRERETITVEALARLATASEGLFKATPKGAGRLLACSRADLAQDMDIRLFEKDLAAGMREYGNKDSESDSLIDAILVTGRQKLLYFRLLEEA